MIFAIDTDKAIIHNSMCMISLLPYTLAGFKPGSSALYADAMTIDHNTTPQAPGQDSAYIGTHETILRALHLHR
jgi:hypothetical protein